MEYHLTIPIKAFYLGMVHSRGQKRLGKRPKAEKMIVKAWELSEDPNFQNKTDHDNFLLPIKEGKLMAIFYLLVLSEISRMDQFNESTDWRLKAKELCDSLNQNKIFNNYMKLIESTIIKSKVIGGGRFSQIKKGTVRSNKPRETHENHPLNYLAKVTDSQFDLVYSVFNVGLSYDDDVWMKQTTLNEILELQFGKEEYSKHFSD
tara:strand:+ start:846 stop:1460 length:615 start_codon:yes stop_codon:yes gene_type:complete